MVIALSGHNKLGLFDGFCKKESFSPELGVNEKGLVLLSFLG